MVGITPLSFTKNVQSADFVFPLAIYKGNETRDEIKVALQPLIEELRKLQSIPLTINPESFSKCAQGTVSVASELPNTTSPASSQPDIDQSQPDTGKSQPDSVTQQPNTEQPQPDIDQTQPDTGQSQPGQPKIVEHKIFWVLVTDLKMAWELFDLQRGACMLCNCSEPGDRTDGGPTLFRTFERVFAEGDFLFSGISSRGKVNFHSHIDCSINLS